MQDMNFFTIIAAVMWGNAATIGILYARDRLKRTDSFDWKSVSAIMLFAGVAISAGYLAT